MGTADIIPGVSGGTIAFITGIYYQLLEAIASVNLNFIQSFFRFDWKSALAEIHIRFLVPLILGIGLAVVSTARLMHYLLKDHPVPTWSLFFGLIGASILVVGKEIQDWKTGTPSIVIGTAAAFGIVGLIPVHTPETWWFILLCGMIAICAMILPGISGSFILLILGKYEFITGAIKNPFDLQNMIILCIFLVGCVIGILGFSRVLSYFLKHYHNITISVLTGLMIGAMRKVWPWKEVLDTQTIRGKVYVIREQNVLPQIDSSFFLAVGIMVIGFVFVILLERWARRTSK